MLFRSAPWLQSDADIACLLYNIGDGVPQPNMLIVHMENTGNLTDVGMEKEDLGLMMSTF